MGNGASSYRLRGLGLEWVMVGTGYGWNGLGLGIELGLGIVSGLEWVRGLGFSLCRVGPGLDQGQG